MTAQDSCQNHHNKKDGWELKHGEKIWIFGPWEHVVAVSVSLVVSYHAGVKGEAKGYNSEIWHWSQHLRAASLFLTRSSLFFVNKMRVICCLWSSITKLQFCYLLIISSNLYISFFIIIFLFICCFFLINVWIYVLFFHSPGSEMRLKTKALLGSARSAYHKSDLSDIFFLKGMNIHPLSVEGPWYLYGQCDLSPYPLRLGVQHRKLHSCCSP